MTEKNISSDDNMRIPSSRRIFAKNLAKLSKLKLENNIKKRGLKRSYILLIPLMFVSVSIIWWLNFAEKNGNIELNIEQVSQSQDANTEMTGARFASRTSDGENFEINAQKAIDNTPEPGLIYLSNPNGTIWTKKGNMIEITSMEAILDQSKEFTLFKGSVKMQQDVVKFGGGHRGGHGGDRSDSGGGCGCCHRRPRCRCGSGRAFAAWRLSEKNFERFTLFWNLLDAF